MKTSEITLIGGSYHLEKSTHKGPRIMAPRTESLPDLKTVLSSSCDAKKSKPVIAEHYELKEYSVHGERQSFYVSTEISNDQAKKLIEESTYEMMRRKIREIEQAVQDYYEALYQREHGDVAGRRAFAKIQDVLGMHWKG